jgi:hypothetical protein
MDYDVYRDGTRVGSGPGMFTDYDLTPGTTYNYQVRETDTYGGKVISSPAPARTLFSGGGSSPPPSTLPPAASGVWVAGQASPDLNGDGRADMAMLYHHADGSITLWSSFADSNGALGPFAISSYSVPAAATWDFNAIRLIAGDFNGDHRGDIAIMYHHADGAISAFTSRADANGLLTEWIPGFYIPAAASWDPIAIRII